jgi:Icc-related predicted phosphoesterase
VIAGNHDFCFERDRERSEAELTHCIYLQDEEVEVAGLRFYGSPWQPWFFDWAFNLRRGAEIRSKWNLIPAALDVLITHGPPFGHGDMTMRGEAVGCKDLLEVVEEVKPRLHIFGHIHEGAGVSENDETTFINACTCDLQYEPVNAPVVFDLAA